MADRKSLVLVAGVPAELPAGDRLVSGGGFYATAGSILVDSGNVSASGAFAASIDSRAGYSPYVAGAGIFRSFGAFNFQKYDDSSVFCSIDATGILPLSTTTASAANVFQSATGTVLLRSTSSAKYKTAIRDLPDAEADAVLSLRPIVYRSKAKADDGRRKHWGLIAEEVHSLLPPLVHFNPEGEPESVQYERVVVGLLSVAQRERRERLALEGRVAALEAAVASLRDQLRI